MCGNGLLSIGVADMSDLQADNNQQPPSRFPERAPDTHYATDHSFTLQAIMEMQKAIGGISAEIKALSAGQQKFETKLDKMEDSLSTMSKQLYAAGVVMLIALAVGGFIVDKAWDLMAEQIKPKIEDTIKK